MSILPNLLCEYEMAGTIGALPSGASAISARWNAVLRLIPGWEEATPIDADAGRTGLPGGAILAWCDLYGIGSSSPEIVGRANDKRTSHAIERELEVALGGARIVSNLTELDRAVDDHDGRWVAKDPFGVAGRERVLGRAGIDPGKRRWCEARFARGVELVWEPWVEEAREWSVHFDVGEEPELVGAVELLTHGGGGFRGIVVGGAPPPDKLVEGAVAAAAQIAALGYRGPLGVDAMVGRLGATEVVRPVVELNARYTFGRLALELARRTDVATWEWRHDRGDVGARGELSEWEALSEGEACRLPEFCDPRGRSGSWCRITRPG